MHPAEKPTGTCPVCHRDGLRLRKNGTVWNHGSGAQYGSGEWGLNCSGAGKRPAPHV